MAVGIVVGILGLWLVLRTVVSNDAGNNLVDMILGFNPA